jgi:hypothetical protein
MGVRRWPWRLLWVPVLFLFARDAAAQSGLPDRPRRVDVEVLYVTGSWLWSVGPTSRLGPELGLGILEQVTVWPDGDDLTGILHVGLMSSTDVSPRASLDLGLRLGIGELRSRSCSGCVPGGYAAATAALFLGRGRLQGGTRLSLGRASGRGFAAWSPLVGRVRF